MNLELDDDPLFVILSDIQSCLNNGMYYAAITVALTLPEVCAALEASNGRGSSEKYKTWYNTYLADLYPLISDDFCYSLRCSVVHQGKFGRLGEQYSRILFTIPDGRGIVFHKGIINDALNLDAITFCRDIMDGAKRWYAAKQGDPNVLKNLPNLVRFRPKGLAPYMVGMPLIA
jgi:hypothetical protein